MAEEKMVEVTLKRSLGVRARGAAVATHYGPGPSKIPLRDAIALGIADEDGKLTQRYRDQQATFEAQRAVSQPPAAGSRKAAGTAGEEEEEASAISDTARTLAEANGVDWSEIEGTGKNGRIVAKDIQAVIDARTDGGGEGGEGGDGA